MLTVGAVTISSDREFQKFTIRKPRTFALTDKRHSLLSSFKLCPRVCIPAWSGANGSNEELFVL